MGARAGDGARRMMRVMLYVLVPPVVFFNLARLELDADVGAGIVLGWVAVVLTGLIAYAVARGQRLPRPQTGSLVNASLHPNTGYLGLPLCAAALGTDSLDQAVAYDVLVGTPTLLLGVFAVGRGVRDEGRRHRPRPRAHASSRATRRCSRRSRRCWLPTSSPPTCSSTRRACSCSRCSRSGSSPSA